MSMRRVVLIGVGVVLAVAVVAWVAALALGGYGWRQSAASTGSATVSTSVQSGEAYSNDSALSTPDAAKGVPTSETGAATPAGAETQRQIVRTATVTMTVRKVPPAVESLRKLVAAAGGEISSLTYSAGIDQPYPLPMAEGGTSGSVRGPQSATVVARVPATKLEPLARSVAGLGEVTAQTAGQDDITAQVVDLEARLKNLQAEEVRLRSFLTKANRVSDMLSIERELSRVRGEIEAMQAQQRYLFGSGRHGDTYRDDVPARCGRHAGGNELGLR